MSNMEKRQKDNFENQNYWKISFQIGQSTKELLYQLRF